jgi:hypothetical protein
MAFPSSLSFAITITYSGHGIVFLSHSFDALASLDHWNIKTLCIGSVARACAANIETFFFPLCRLFHLYQTHRRGKIFMTFASASIVQNRHFPEIYGFRPESAVKAFSARLATPSSSTSMHGVMPCVSAGGERRLQAEPCEIKTSCANNSILVSSSLSRTLQREEQH